MVFCAVGLFRSSIFFAISNLVFLSQCWPILYLPLIVTGTTLIIATSSTTFMSWVSFSYPPSGWYFFMRSFSALVFSFGSETRVAFPLITTLMYKVSACDASVGDVKYDG